MNAARLAAIEALANAPLCRCRCEQSRRRGEAVKVLAAALRKARELAERAAESVRLLMQVGYDDGPEEEAMAAALAAFDAAKEAR